MDGEAAFPLWSFLFGQLANFGVVTQTCLSERGKRVTFLPSKPRPPVCGKAARTVRGAPSDGRPMKDRLCPFLADFVAKVFLHSRSKFLLAVHATFV
jgi:hypothetical protein